MTWTETAPGVFHSIAAHARFTAGDVPFLVRQAQANPKRRARLCAHATTDDPVQEMLICLLPDGYVRPHRHNKAESLHAIEGAVDLVLFDEGGEVDEVISLGTTTDQVQFVRLAPATYHTLCVASEHFVFHETARGPLDRADTEFAPWAPDESDAEAARAYMEQLEASIRRR